jgi:hypothetical protein
VLGPLVLSQVLVDADQPEDLPARGLEVKVRVWHVEHLDAEGDNLLPHLRDVVSLQFQVGRFQKPAVIQGDAFALVEERYVEAAAQTEVVLLITLSRDLTTQDIAIEGTDPIPFCPGNSDRRMIAEDYLCHDHSTLGGRVAGR